MKAKQIKKLKDLAPDPKNANRHTERGGAAMEASIRNFGFGDSMTVSSDGVVLSGNQRLETLADIQMDDPIVVESDGTRPIVHVRTDLKANDKRARGLATAQNRVGQLNLDWDPAILAELVKSDIKIEEMFSEKELVQFMAGLNTPIEEGHEAQIDKAAELQVKWKTERGQIWEIGSHRLMCGDSASQQDVGLLVRSKKFSCVLTDPPFGQDQKGVPHDSPKESEDLMDNATASLPLLDGIAVAFQSPRTFLYWTDAARRHGHRFERMLWLYKTAQTSFPWRGWLLTSEAIVITTIGNPRWNEVRPFTHDCYQLSEVSPKTSGLSMDVGWHGSVKPLSVVTDILSRISAKKEGVFDGFLGSGTTLIAAEKTGRICYGMEIEPKYVAVCLQRMADMGLKPKLVKK